MAEQDGSKITLISTEDEVQRLSALNAPTTLVQETGEDSVNVNAASADKSTALPYVVRDSPPFAETDGVSVPRPTVIPTPLASDEEDLEADDSGDSSKSADEAELLLSALYAMLLTVPLHLVSQRFTRVL